jgi:hypothetical protein
MCGNEILIALLTRYTHTVLIIVRKIYSADNVFINVNNSFVSDLKTGENIFCIFLFSYDFRERYSQL